jgi:hypothetical protein
MVAALTGCSEDPFSGDPFPIPFDRSSGAVLLPVKHGSSRVLAAVDVMAPITIVEPATADTPVRRSNKSLTLLAPRPDVAADCTSDDCFLARARFTADVFELHACEGECQIGAEGDARAIGAIIGADALASDAIRFDFAQNQMFVLPDVAGADSARNRLCDGVLQTPFRGGGTLFIDGAEVLFGGRRIAIGACLVPPLEDPSVDLDTPPPLGGGDALFVLSTGIGVSLLGVSAYRRLLEALGPDAGLAPIDDGASRDGTVVLPSGAITGWKRALPRIALVATTGSNPRGPCRELYTHRLMTRRNCRASDPVRCPCSSGDTHCGVPATIELSPTEAIPILVVADEEPTLQSLRAELRPDEAEVDGILGTDALASLVVDIDYPHNRVLARCADPSQCLVRPQLGDGDPKHRARVQACLPDGGVEVVVDAGEPDAADTEPVAR